LCIIGNGRHLMIQKERKHNKNFSVFGLKSACDVSIYYGYHMSLILLMQKSAGFYSQNWVQNTQNSWKLGLCSDALRSHIELKNGNARAARYDSNAWNLPSSFSKNTLLSSANKICVTMQTANDIVNCSWAFDKTD
jgi:hypothetical protein